MNITIADIQTDSRLITGASQSSTSLFRTVSFTVAKSASIIQQDPILENGMLIGYKNPRTIDFGDLKPGMNIVALIRIIPNESFVAYQITAGDPFPRF